ncbi:hypothetical protein [Streptomyces sp. 029-5]|uniref:hypothetical protein n=1 Tax=Streptomyces sp. 029-5 TaxID=2789261 RepID=UPI00397ECD48
MDESEPYETTRFTGDTPWDQVEKSVKRWLSTPKRDLQPSLVVHTALISHGVDLDLLIRDESHRYLPKFNKRGGDEETARKRLRSAADTLKEAATASQRRSAVVEFLSALGELILCLLRFVIRVLLALLSLLLGRVTADDVPGWTTDPIDATPQITPRGPTPAFPVNINRGGQHSSRALGSAVLAA